MTEKHEQYCSTVPRTLVHDCSVRIAWHILTYSKFKWSIYNSTVLLCYMYVFTNS